MDAATEAYAVIISDRLIDFQSNGNKTSVVFQDFFPIYKKNIKTKDLKEILKENHTDFLLYWDKIRLVELVKKTWIERK